MTIQLKTLKVMLKRVKNTDQKAKISSLQQGNQELKRHIE